MSFLENIMDLLQNIKTHVSCDASGFQVRAYELNLELKKDHHNQEPENHNHEGWEAIEYFGPLENQYEGDNM